MLGITTILTHNFIHISRSHSKSTRCFETHRFLVSKCYRFIFLSPPVWFAHTQKVSNSKRSMCAYSPSADSYSPRARWFNTYESFPNIFIRHPNRRIDSTIMTDECNFCSFWHWVATRRTCTHSQWLSLWFSFIFFSRIWQNFSNFLLFHYILLLHAVRATNFIRLNIEHF